MGSRCQAFPMQWLGPAWTGVGVETAVRSKLGGSILSATQAGQVRPGAVRSHPAHDMPSRSRSPPSQVMPRLVPKLR